MLPIEIFTEEVSAIDFEPTHFYTSLEKSLKLLGDLAVIPFKNGFIIPSASTLILI